MRTQEHVHVQIESENKRAVRIRNDLPVIKDSSLSFESSFIDTLVNTLDFAQV